MKVNGFKYGHIDFGSPRVSTIEMSCTSHIVELYAADDSVVWLRMRASSGRYVQVPCTYIAAQMIGLYDVGVPLTLYILPTICDDDGEDKLLPLCFGACRAERAE